MLTCDHERSKINLPPTNTSDVKTTLHFKHLKVLSLKLTIMVTKSSCKNKY